MARISKEAKALSIAKVNEAVAIDETMSEWLCEAYYNPYKYTSASLSAIDKEGHIYFMTANKEKLAEIEGRVAELLNEGEYLVAKVEVVDYDLPFAVKVLIEDLVGLELKFENFFDDKIVKELV